MSQPIRCPTLSMMFDELFPPPSPKEVLAAPTPDSAATDSAVTHATAVAKLSPPPSSPKDVLVAPTPYDFATDAAIPSSQKSFNWFGITVPQPQREEEGRPSNSPSAFSSSASDGGAAVSRRGAPLECASPTVCIGQKRPRSFEHLLPQLALAPPIEQFEDRIKPLSFERELPSLEGPCVTNKHFNVTAKALSKEAFGDKYGAALHLYDGKRQIKVKTAMSSDLKALLLSVPLNKLMQFRFIPRQEVFLVEPDYQVVDCRCEVFLESFAFFELRDPPEDFPIEARRLADMIEPPTKIPEEQKKRKCQQQQQQQQQQQAGVNRSLDCARAATSVAQGGVNRTILLIPESTTAAATPTTNNFGAIAKRTKPNCFHSLVSYVFFVRVGSVKWKSRLCGVSGPRDKNVRVLTLSDSRKEDAGIVVFNQEVTPGEYCSLMARAHCAKAEGLRGTLWAVVGRAKWIPPERQSLYNGEGVREVRIESDLSEWSLIQYQKPVDSPGQKRDEAEEGADAFGLHDANESLAGLP